jgi:protoporphyrinogen oxidase
MRNHRSLIVIGAGPAGLAAAHEATRCGIQPLVLEKARQVGGIARTEVHRGYRFDVGGHRFFTKVPSIDQLWHQMLGEDLLRVSRLSRIRYGGRFFNYPLDPLEALSKLGLHEAARIAPSYLWARLRPLPEEKTFEQWIVNRFGRRLYEIFFQTYTEKVWGMPGHRIRADWAAQRIRGISLRTVLLNAVCRANHARTLIREFQYPRLGPGMMWQRFRDTIEGRGGRVRLESEVTRLERDGTHITGVVVDRRGQEECIAGDQVISSMPLADLLARLDPGPPKAVARAARGLRHRDFIIVCLIVSTIKPFPDHWIYVHDPAVRAGRIQGFRNWSAALVPDPRKASLGVEYFCTVGDDVWRMTNAQLVALARHELTRLGLVAAEEVEEGTVIRQPRAYPVYNAEYRTRLATIRRFLSRFDNLQTIGRNGLHRYNNMDHSMLTGMLATENICGKRHNLWEVNTERVYHEEDTRFE